jgi:hypothetical protein
MEEANRRLAAFARRAKVAVAAAASALVAAAGAMIRSGLQVVDAQAKLAASLAPPPRASRSSSAPATSPASRWARSSRRRCS